MNFIFSHLLSLIVFTPLLGAIVVMLLPGHQKRLIRWVAFGLSLIPFILSVVLWVNFVPGEPGYQFVEQADWLPALGVRYHVGVDGLSLTLILLTTLLTPLGVLISFSIEEHVRSFFALFLFLETGILGYFVALDLIIFFIFWEIGLVPMYFLINQWGSANRRYASLKFFLYTMAGSLAMLLAIQVIWIASRSIAPTGTFDIPLLTQMRPFTGEQVLPFLPQELARTIAFWAFVIAFAIKVPIWPVHTWLPDAHTEAPTAGSMILAGVLLKMGAYGFLRVVIPFFPAEAARFALALAVLALLSILMGAYAAYGQTDFKRLVAYSSINHMGIVILGIAVAAATLGTKQYAEHGVMAYNGAVLQMFNHGLTSAALFALVGMVYERTHTRDLSAYGGLWVVMPAYGGILIYSAMANLGLPGLGSFVSEFLVVRGAWPVYTLITALAMIGLVMTAAFTLMAVQRVLHGPLNPRWKGLREITWREGLAMAPLMIGLLAIGVWPRWILDVINAAAQFL
ncbi:MAG: NADH-quinone oxidoreductase subunit M [Chloroflexi bacterium]|nr:MAG: NADH-quinone oxidoreductase subunit M [Chloroflexota bacterium]